MRNSIRQQAKIIIVGVALATVSLSMGLPAVSAAPVMEETTYSVARYLPSVLYVSMSVPAKKGKQYAFLSVGPDGSPDRWNPCKPITWGIAAKGFPAKELPLIKQAFNDVSKATGLTFTYTGIAKKYSTSEFDHMPSIPNVDISLRWEDFKKTTPSYAGAAGYGGRRVSWGSSSPLRHVGPGQARFDLSNTVYMTSAQKRTLYLHELGHVIGLDHVDDRRNLMYPSVANVTRFAAGDLAGLKLLGKQAGDCDPGTPYYNEAFPPPAPDGSTAAPGQPQNLAVARTEEGLLITWNDPAGSIVSDVFLTVDSADPNSRWYGPYGYDQLDGPNGQYLVELSELEGLPIGETIVVRMYLSNDSGQGKEATVNYVWSG